MRKEREQGCQRYLICGFRKTPNPQETRLSDFHRPSTRKSRRVVHQIDQEEGSRPTRRLTGVVSIYIQYDDMPPIKPVDLRDATRLHERRGTY